MGKAMIPDAVHGLSWTFDCDGASGAKAPPVPFAGGGCSVGSGVRAIRGVLHAAVCWAILAIAGCHSYHVETTIENRTGEPVRLLEVDYPSASYGADSLAAGAEFHYRIQLDGKGQLKVLYTTAEGKPVQIIGPALAERQEGRLEIVLLPGGKAEFHPQLTPAR
jgi:hypothetical protein